MSKSTRYELFLTRWKGGCGSDLCSTARHVCLGKGQLPADVLFVGEAPGQCIAGDTLIETAFRDKRDFPNGIPISQLVGKSGFKVYSYDVEKKCLVLGTVNKVWRTGFKKVFKVTFFWWGAPPNGKGGRHKYFGEIKVTSNHPFLLKNGEYLSINGGLKVGNRLQPFYRFVSNRRYRVGVSSDSMKREAVLLLEDKLGRKVEDREQCHHSDRNPENDSWNNLVLMDIAEHARLHGFEDNAMFNPIHKETHKNAMSSEDYRKGQSDHMRNHLSDPEAYKKRVKQIRSHRKQTSSTVKNKYATDPVYYYHYLIGKKFRNGQGYSIGKIKSKFLEKFPDSEYPPEENHQIVSIEEIGLWGVYDMEVEHYHNFAANGVFVHNSEDVIGLPFCGPAGKELDRWIDRAGLVEMGLRISWTNLVSCIPLGEDGRKTEEPDDESVRCCGRRLQEWIDLAQPRVIVCVGRLAKDYLEQGYKYSVKLPTLCPECERFLYRSSDGWTCKKGHCWSRPGRALPQVAIDHPAYVLRQNVAQRGLLAQKQIIRLRSVAEVLGSKAEDKHA